MALLPAEAEADALHLFVEAVMVVAGRLVEVPPLEGQALGLEVVHLKHLVLLALADQPLCVYGVHHALDAREHILYVPPEPVQ